VYTKVIVRLIDMRQVFYSDIVPKLKNDVFTTLNPRPPGSRQV
jgi:hypothetical protein